MKTFNNKGFSLIEMMIVLAVMGILAAIAVPNFQQYMGERRLNGAARMVASDLMLARQKSVTKNNNFKIFFNADQHSYTILDDTDNNGTVGTGETITAKDVQTEYYDVTFTASADPISYPRGTAFGTTVTLTSAKTGGNKYVKVATTGRVKIDDVP